MTNDYNEKVVVLQKFIASALCNCFRENPICFVDVGARWGVSESFTPISSILSLLAFEADKLEAENLSKSLKVGSNFHSVQVLPYALSKEEGRGTLHITSRPNNSSLFEVNNATYERYSLNGFELDKVVPVHLKTLDDIVSKTDKFTPDVIKLDTQGSELNVLSGSEECLKSTLCVISEVAFFSPYDGVPDFAEIHNFLKSRGFTFYGFHDFQHRGTKLLNKRLSAGAERLMQADAIYFRDPKEKNIDLSKRDALALIILCLINLYNDFAAELISLPVFDEKDSIFLREIIDEIATPSKAEMDMLASQLRHAVENHRSEKSELLISLGKIVDQRRELPTYHEINSSK